MDRLGDVPENSSRASPCSKFAAGCHAGLCEQLAEEQKLLELIPGLAAQLEAGLAEVLERELG